MIRVCSCTKSLSSLENPKIRESSKSCKSCGGRLSVDRRRGQLGSMLSNGGLELSRVIDPHLTWKTASNGRQRAMRRARTSFTGTNGNIFAANSLEKSSKHPTDKDLNSTRDMPVSESEKVGVSILGRRFSETLGSVPIKKRRFMLSHSSSPPDSSFSCPDDSGHFLGRQTASSQGFLLDVKQHSVDTNAGPGLVSGQEREFNLEKTALDGENEKLCDAADFSGISILAAAACDSNIGADLKNVECLLSKVHGSEVQGVLEENAKLGILQHGREMTPSHTSEDLDGRTDLPLEVSVSSALPSKESNEVKSDGSSSLQTLVHSSQNDTIKTTESSSRDVRFHWDLNTVMDAWEGHEETMNSDREATANLNLSKDADDIEKLGNAELPILPVGFGDTKTVLTGLQNVDSMDQPGGREQKVISVSGVKTVREVSSNEYEDTTGQVQHLKDDGVGLAGLCDGTKSLIIKTQSCSVSRDLLSPVGVPEPSASAEPEGSLLSDTDLVDSKTEAHHIRFHCKVETRSSLSCLVPCDHAISHPTNASELSHGIVRSPIESGTDVEMSDSTHTTNPQTEKVESSCVDLGVVMGDGNVVAPLLVEKGCEILANENVCEGTLTGCEISGESAHMNGSMETDSDIADKTEQKSVCGWDTIAVDTEMNNTNAHIHDLGADQSEPPVNTGAEVSSCMSTDMIPCSTAALPVFISQGPSNKNTDHSACEPVQISPENNLKCYYSDASPNDADQVNGMEKVEFLGDDDSQYEDGEFREPLENYWLDDGAEEVESERVDYGSDRDADIREAVSDFSSIDKRVNAQVMTDASHDNQYQEVGTGAQSTSRSFRNSPSRVNNVADTGSGKRNVGNAAVTGLQGYMRTDGKDAFSTEVGGNGLVKEADVSQRSSQSGGFRKTSGWDRLPGGYRNYDNGVMESRLGPINRNHNATSSGPSRAGDYTNRNGETYMRRNQSSRTERTERVQSYDLSRRTDKSHVRPSRSSDRNGVNARVERERDDHRSIGRSGPSFHVQGRARGDHCVDSSNHYGNGRHDSSGYFGSSSFSHHGSRNAAAVAVAKVESNGFVVAPDGTIVKAGGARSAGHLTQRAARSSSQNGRHSPILRGSPIERERSFGMPSGHGRPREMSPDRHIFTGGGMAGRYGPGVSNVRHRERYPGSTPHGIVESSSLMRHAISRRDRSFSPHQRPLLLSRSHSRSPSRSRTRSPHRWVSPGLRRRSRSPIFKSEARMDRPRAGHGEGFVSYSSLSRNHASPPYASRWNDERRDTREHIRDYEYRRFSGTSRPTRAFSPCRRFDMMDTHEKLRSDEYSRPTNSGRLPGYVGFGRGSRHEGKGDDRREHGDRCEMFHSARQYVNDGKMERLRYDDGHGLMAKRPNTSEFQPRENLRAMDTVADRQPGDPPQRSEEEKGHSGNSRDDNHNANMKSVSVQEGDDDNVGTQRLS